MDLENIVVKELKIDMTKGSSNSCLKNLFINFVYLIRRNDLNWVQTVE